MFSNLGKILAGAVFAVGMFANSALAEEEYPHDVVTLVTHSSPGSGSDVFLRNLIKHLAPIMGTNFVVENVKGGSGSRAMSRLANSPADGRIFYATTPTFIFTSLLSNPENTYRDLEPLVNVFIDEEVLFTRADGPFKTLADVIDAAKEDRGRWGASTPGSLERQTMERLKKAAGVEAAIVTHSGGGEMMINVINGTLDMGVGEFAELRPQIEAGKVKLLAVFSEKRLEGAPDLPTVSESGYDVIVRKFRGLAGPKGLSDDIIAYWERGIQAVLDDPEYQEVYKPDMLSPGFIPHDEYVQFINQFAEESETFFKETGVIQ